MGRGGWLRLRDASGEMRSAAQTDANSVTELVISSRISSREREVSAIGVSSTAWIVVMGYVVTVVGTNAFQAAFWLIPSDALKGRDAAVGVAAIGSIGMIGSFIGPYLWGIARDVTGSYRVGALWLVAAHLVGAAILVVARRVARAPSSLAVVAGTLEA